MSFCRQLALFIALGMFAGCSGSARSPEPAAPSPVASEAVTCPVGYPAAATLTDWSARVQAAQALKDSVAKRDALVELVRVALGQETEVRLAGNSNPTRPDARDYAPFPVVNFDMNLGNKQNTNTAYFFSARDKAYVILGPGAVHIRGPITTQQNAQHEAFHAQYHVGDARPVLDREVEVWTHIFTNTFHDVYPYKMLWSPLMSSYENASPAERRIALHLLAKYYEAPPVKQIGPSCVDQFRAEFAAWAGRRFTDEKNTSKTLLRDLYERLNLPMPQVPAPIAPKEKN